MKLTSHSIRTSNATAINNGRNVLLVVAATLCTLVAEAGIANPLAQPVRIVAVHATLRASGSNDIQDFALRCPAGHIPAAMSVIPAHDEAGFFELAGRQLIDATDSPIDAGALTDTAPLNGAGYVVALAAVGEARRRNWNFELMLQCASALATTDETLALATTTTVAAAASMTTVSAFCPADFPVAFGGFSNADGARLRELGSAPAWGGSAKVMRLSDVADGQTSAPTGWQTVVTNRAPTSIPYVVHALCGKAPSAQTFVYSAPAISANASSIFGAVPDEWIALGASFDSGPSGANYAVDAWIKDGTVVSLQAWHPSAVRYDSASAAPRAFIFKRLDRALANDSVSNGQGRVVLAVLSIPTPGGIAPPLRAQVIEFYNADLDHYFITANPKEIADLDNEGYTEWIRTGQTFEAYAIGSSGRTGRRPVCRAYGQPHARLDSHFFSASSDECLATLADFEGIWTLEASEVFAMDLPDSVTGACPENGLPIFRTWNGRVDSNHRYTTSLDLRDQMVAKGHIAEGYGPNAVTLCGLR